METPSHDCPFGAEHQQYWNRLSATERMMHLDRDTIASLTLQRTMKEIVPRTPGRLILDLFCGAGGSSIGFARGGKRVMAVDISKSCIEMARYNAELYGVEDKIQFRNDEAIELLSELNEIRADTVFLDPPLISKDSVVNAPKSLSDFYPDGALLLELLMPRFRNIVFKVPASLQLQELNSFSTQYEVQDNLFEETLLHRTVYF